MSRQASQYLAQNLYDIRRATYTEGDKVRPLGETRPGWKVLRVLGTMLGLPGFAYETIEEVRAAALPTDIASRLSNASTAHVEVAPAAAPVTASIYQLDGLVRRAPSLQATADAAGGH